MCAELVWMRCHGGKYLLLLRAAHGNDLRRQKKGILFWWALYNSCGVDLLPYFTYLLSFLKVITISIFNICQLTRSVYMQYGEC